MVNQRTRTTRIRWARGTARTGSLRLGILTCGVALLWGATAHASGISSARFGGEHGHPTTDNATAIYYNPAGIALSNGTHVFADATLALRWASYTRPTGNGVQNSPLTLELAPGANDGKATLFNAIVAPFAGVTSDFGTNFIYGGVAVYFPFGGAAAWDENPTYADSNQFPGAVDGVQRWYSIDGTIRSMYATAALGFNIRKIGLSIGLSGSAIRSEVETLRARNADGTDDIVLPLGDDEYQLKEGRSYINVNGWQGGFGVGLVYDVLKQGRYFIGASYTSQPGFSGGMTLTGTLDNALGTSAPARTNVELTQTMPDILRLGVRIRPTDKYEIRVFADYTRWSVFDKQCVLLTDEPERSCEFAGADSALDDPESFGADAPPGVTQHLPRFWKDAGGVRVGASYWFVPQVEGYVGLGYDSSAVPDQTIDPALIDSNKVSVSLGARWQIAHRFAMAFTATELIFFKNSTEGKSALNRFQQPTKQPNADGVYRQFFQLFNIYADFSF